MWSHADAHVFICFGRRVRRSQRRGARFFDGPWHRSTVGGRKGHKEASRPSDGNDHQSLGADGDPSGSSAAAEPIVHPEILGQGGFASGDIASDERQEFSFGESSVSGIGAVEHLSWERLSILMCRTVFFGNLS